MKSYRNAHSSVPVGERSMLASIVIATVAVMLVLGPATQDANTATRADEVSSPVITSPTNGFVTGDISVPIVGTADPGLRIEISVNGDVSSVLTSVDVDGNWSRSAQLVEGHNLVSVVAIDDSDVRSLPTSVSVVYDRTDPVVTLVSPKIVPGKTTRLLSYFSTPSVPIEFTVTDTHPGRSECRIDTTIVIECQSGKTLPPLPDGLHSVSVRHTDAVGNRGDSTENAYFLLYRKPPNTKAYVRLNRDRKWYKKTGVTAIFGFSPDNQAATFKCRLKPTAKYKTCTEGGKKLRPGRYVLSVYAVDPLGRKDRTPVTIKFKVPKQRR